MAIDDVQILYTGEFLQTCRRRHWEFVRRVNSSGCAAFVVATTEDACLLLVQQFRHPVQASVIELPAGIVGDQAEGESPAVAAGRELEEETGYRAAELELLHCSPTAPGLSSEWAYHYRARQVQRVHSGGGVEDEEILVHRVPLVSAMTWLAQQQQAGVIIDARVYAALAWLSAENA
nr:NUDIX hydrolase [Oceanococcus sp. HetDA_MAG_MS8]